MLSRPWLWVSSRIVRRTSSLFPTASAKTPCSWADGRALHSQFFLSPRSFLHALRPRGLPGRSDVFPDRGSSIWRSSLFSISSLFLLACSWIACNCSLNFQVFKWRGRSLDWCRASCCCFTLQLSWSFCADKLAGCLRMSKSSDSRRHEDWLSLMSRIPLNFILRLRSARLEG